MEDSVNCPFCQVDEANILHQNDFGLVIYDDNPVSKGHSLVIPRRHISSFFDVSDKERKSLITLIELARNQLNLIYQPDGFHVGFNDGHVANQRIDHLHIHIIPRYSNQLLHLDQRWGVISKSATE
ncbi:HIT family protein [Acinetobacter populi]|jgi:diadenosine tetraphosphate (Ap4A) HIT family hydrolase|uniref:HIT family protein n=1 Tax=Acinetobacter populi TaxID=1582270 RepID=A0A1Z9YX43_9GAMM|nr:HIT family protein [Acinetobacter populi]MCH4247733.1 HIT family protein [Acinetobacter populi]OUY06771.1 HIT family protein [Acinetobacter populi]